MPKFITMRKRDEITAYKPISFKKKLMTGLLTGAMMAMACFPAFAEGTTTTTIVTADDWQPIIDAVTAQFNVQTIVAVLATIVTSVIGLVFMWWGGRKALASLMGAVRSGRGKV